MEEIVPSGEVPVIEPVLQPGVGASKKKIMAGVGGLLLLVIGLGVGVYMSRQKQNPQTKAFSEGVILPKPIAEWTFDEGSGKQVRDSAKNHNGRWNGTGRHWVDGKFDKAGTFNGTDDYVAINKQPEISSFTISGWVNFNSTDFSNFQEVFNNNQLFLRKENDTEGNKISVFVKLSDGSVENRASSTTIPVPGQWYHVAGTWDGNVLKMYVNGVLEGSSQRAGTLTTTAIQAQIGRGEQESLTGNQFSGSIDQVRIYDYALTGAQVLKDMGVETAVPQTTTTISDDFNGASLDVTKWATTGDAISATATLSGGKLIISIPQQTSQKSFSVNSLQNITGDFSADVELTSVQVIGGNSGSAELFFVGGGQARARVSRYSNGTSERIEAAFDTGSPVSVNLSSGTGNVIARMVRVGNTMQLFYNTGSGFNLLTSATPASVADGTFKLIAIALGPNFPATTSTFDNFFARVNLAQRPQACPTVQGPEIKDVTGVVQTKATGSFTWLQKTGETPKTVRVDCGDISWTRERLAGDGPSDIPMSYADVKVGHKIKIKGGFFETNGGSVIQAALVQDMSLRVTTIEGKISSTASGMLTLNGGRKIQVDDKAGCRSVKGTAFNPARCVILAVKHDIRAVGVYDEIIKTMVGPAVAGIWTKITDLSVTP